MKPYLFAKPFLRLRLTAVMISFLLFSCSKSSFDSKHPKKTHAFTNLPDSADDRLHCYVDSLLVRESTRPFMDSVLNAVGIPGWQFSTFGLQRGNPAAMVPLLGSDKVTGLLVMVVDGGRFRFRIIDSRKPERYGFDNGAGRANARSIFFAADLFNQRAFADKPAVTDDPCLMTRRERKHFENARRTGGEPGITNVRAVPYVLSITCYTTIACTGDGLGNCIGNIVYSTDCVYDYIWVDQWSDYSGGGNGTSGGNDGGYGGGGGGSAPTQPDPSLGQCSGAPNGGGEIQLAVMPPAKPIYDVPQYIQCFSRNNGAKITFYADQPVPGTSEVMSIKELVGHAFITIEQNIGGQQISRAVGFHPEAGVDPILTKNGRSIFGDDSRTEYDVKYAVDVAPETLDKIMSFIENKPPEYHIEKYNCVNFLLDISDICGAGIPRTKGRWLVGSGLNPGNLGQDMRKMPGAVTKKGESPENSGTCN